MSAGLLVYRFAEGVVQVFLVHPGGPFWAGKDEGAWSIPKGERSPGEDLLNAARREFQEETGFTATGPFLPLTPRRQKSGKLIHAWACPGDPDPDKLVSNPFTREWPPRSGRLQGFPEVDRAGWFALDAAREKLVPGQRGFLEELASLLARGHTNGGPPPPDPGVEHGSE
jgi:predicted NUDIX family NTP pyrophosphohydrolase